MGQAIFHKWGSILLVMLFMSVAFLFFSVLY